MEASFVNDGGSRLQQIGDKKLRCQSTEMAQPLEPSLPEPHLTKFDFFLQLPIEIRNMIYEPLVQAAMVHNRPPLYGLPSWQTPSFNYAHKLDLHITTSKVIFRNMRFRVIYPLFTLNRQVHDELSALIYSRIRHVKITGDFLFGLNPTQQIFDMLERRPWMQKYVKSLTIELRLCGIHPACNSVDINKNILAQHPFLWDRLRNIYGTAKLLGIRIKRGKCARDCGTLLAFLLSMGYSYIARTLWRTKSTEHNTLPELAKVLDNFSNLENIDLESEHHHLISLFSDPLETAIAFAPLREKGVEVNVLLRKWQLRQWSNLMARNGVNSANLMFQHENGEGVGIEYENRTGRSMLSYGMVRFKFLDCLGQTSNNVVL